MHIRIEKRKRRKKEERENERTNYEHNVQERTRSKYSLSTVNIYAERVLRSFAKSRNAQSSANVILICFLLTVIINISFNTINEYYSSFI